MPSEHQGRRQKRPLRYFPMTSLYIGPDEGEKTHPWSAILPGPRGATRTRGSRSAFRSRGQRRSAHHQDHEAEFTLGEEVVRADAGTWVSAPLGMLHGFRNSGQGDLRILNIHTPNTGFASRLREES